MASTLVLKITKKMNCGSCTGRVKAALEALDFVTSANVSLEAQTATCEIVEGAGGGSPQKAMMEALTAVGYSSELTNCGGSAGACPAQALGMCTCGPDCQCGDNCDCASCPAPCGKNDQGQACPAKALGTCTCGDNCKCGDNCACASCPGTCGKTGGACPAKALGTCTCGPNCKCGDNCDCTSCPGKEVRAPASDVLSKIGVAVALLAIGFVAGRKSK